MFPLIPLAIKGGLMLGSSLLGNKLSKSKPSKLEQEVLSGDLETQKLARSQGQNILGMGTAGIQQPMNYWQSLLSGNKATMTSALAPEISQIGQGYQQAARTSAALRPRGGPTAAFMSQLPFQQQRDVSTLQQQARPMAAGQLGNLGMSLLSQGTNLLQASTGAGRNILEQQRQQRQMEADRGRSIGGGLFDIIQKYGFPAIDDWLKGGGTPRRDTVQSPYQ